MLVYNIRIALKSLRRNPVLSAVIVGGVMLGITISTMFSTIRHSFAKDPIPQKSGSLFYVRLDNWDPLRPYVPDRPTIPPTQITYRDMRAIMASSIPVRQSGMFRANLWVSVPRGQAQAADAPAPSAAGTAQGAAGGAGILLRPERTEVRLCFSDFFSMFDVPFQYGSGWDKRADEGPEPVAVLSGEENEKLFGGVNSVGRTVRIQDRDFKVIGVIGRWRPSIRFYDLTQQFIAPPEPVFIPFNHMPPMKIGTAGNSDGWRSAPAPGFEGVLASETCWIQFWAELPTEAKLREYEDFLEAYVLEQKKLGRFGRPLNIQVTSVLPWMVEQGVVPNETNAMVIVSLLFLAVCSLNLTGLLLGKFLARSAEVGVRRALGARRLDIFLQHLIECEIVGVIGGLLGIVLSAGGLSVLNTWMMNVLRRGDLFRIDVPMMALAIGLSLVAGLIAGLYPAWRICRIPPAVHLKVQ